MRAESDLLVEMGVKDTASQCTIVQAPCTLQGARCQTQLVSRGTRRLLIYSSQAAIAPGGEAGGSTIRQGTACGDMAPPEYSLCL